MSNSEDDQRSRFLRSCPIKDLRTECRNRGLTPAGGRDALIDRLSDAMKTTKQTSFGQDGGNDVGFIERSKNNYSRPEGQNVGNFITDRASSRVLAPPGGKSSVNFFGATAPSVVVGKSGSSSPTPKPQPEPPAPPPPAPEPVIAKKPEGLSLADNEYAKEAPAVGVRSGDNNYSRPGQRQNIGNYITGRNTSRVLAPPGGGSSVSLG